MKCPVTRGQCSVLTIHHGLTQSLPPPVHRHCRVIMSSCDLRAHAPRTRLSLPSSLSFTGRINAGVALGDHVPSPRRRRHKSATRSPPLTGSAARRVESSRGRQPIQITRQLLMAFAPRRRFPFKGAPRFVIFARGNRSTKSQTLPASTSLRRDRLLRRYVV